MNVITDLLILNNAEAAPTVDWVFVIAGVLLLGFSVLMYKKLKK